MDIVITIAVFPYELFAHMVKLVDERIVVGVPDIDPLLKDKPFGNVGVTAQVDAATALLIAVMFMLET